MSDNVISFQDAALRVRLKRKFTAEQLLDGRRDPAIRAAYLLAYVHSLRSQGATDAEIRAGLDVVNDGLDRLSDREIEVIIQAGSSASLRR